MTPNTVPVACAGPGCKDVEYLSPEWAREGRRRFCSEECRDAYHAEQNREEIPEHLHPLIQAVWDIVNGMWVRASDHHRGYVISQENIDRLEEEFYSLDPNVVLPILGRADVLEECEARSEDGQWVFEEDRDERDGTP